MNGSETLTRSSAGGRPGGAPGAAGVAGRRRAALRPAAPRRSARRRLRRRPSRPAGAGPGPRRRPARRRCEALRDDGGLALDRLDGDGPHRRPSSLRPTTYANVPCGPCWTTDGGDDDRAACASRGAGAPSRTGSARARAFGLSKMALSRMVAVAWLIWLSMTVELALAERACRRRGCSASTVERPVGHRLRDRRQVVLRQREEDRDRDRAA